MKGPSPEIRRLFEVYKESVFQKDPIRLAGIYDEGIIVFDMWSKFRVSGKGEWAEEIRSWLSSLGDERVVVEFSEIESMRDEVIAFASAFVSFKAVAADGSELRSMKNRLTWNIAKRGEDWLIVHQHTSAPIDSATTKAIFNP
jgi:ketosteroid isomerase-like protein